MQRSIALAGIGALAALTFATPAAAGGRPFDVDLSSANEVPPSETGATGTAELTINPGLGEVCFEIAADGLAGTIVAGHIHLAPAGQNGGVVVNFGLSADNLSGCVDVDRDLALDIMRNASSYYVNVHTTAVPSGEIRGQLAD